MTAYIFVNPASGPDDTATDELTRQFPMAEVSECAPADLADRIRATLDKAPDWIGIAGGDGTIRTAAQQMAGRGVPLLAIPAGTRNHFARDVGLCSIEDAAGAATAPVAQPIDVGSVNGRRFVNNASIGVYPALVLRRQQRERSLPKGLANLAAAWEQLRRGRANLEVDLGAGPCRAWMVFVGNGQYGEGLTDLAQRQRLDGGELDLRLVRADARLARLRVVGALLTGRLARSPMVVTARPSSFTLRLPSPRVDVALDGEVETLDCPLRFECEAGALEVLVPA